ncbi:MAG: hypothetical protein ABEJ67_03150 [Halanaeroarchaeum sp.]
MGIDPGTGEETVVDLDGETGATVPDERDPNLFMYGILHEEIRARISHHYQSLLSGLSIIGVIIAYALLSGEFVFLAVIPVLIGFLVVQTVRQLNRIYLAATHLRDIEAAYIEDYPLFSWEHRYGMTGTGASVRKWGINWTHVPQAMVLAMAAVGYLGSIYVAFAVWPPDGMDVLLIGLTRTGLLAIYLLVTVVLLVAWYSFRLHRQTFGHGPD